MHGKAKETIPETGTFIWVDVRDLALCHVKAIEEEAAENKRFFVTAGYFSNKEIAAIIRKNFPKYADKLPSESTPGGTYPQDGIYKYNNKRATEIFGMKWRSLEDCITDTVKSLQDINA